MKFKFNMDQSDAQRVFEKLEKMKHENFPIHVLLKIYSLGHTDMLANLARLVTDDILDRLNLMNYNFAYYLMVCGSHHVLGLQKRMLDLRRLEPNLVLGTLFDQIAQRKISLFKVILFLKDDDLTVDYIIYTHKKYGNAPIEFMKSLGPILDAEISEIPPASSTIHLNINDPKHRQALEACFYVLFKSDIISRFLRVLAYYCPMSFMAQDFLKAFQILATPKACYNIINQIIEEKFQLQKEIGSPMFHVNKSYQFEYFQLMFLGNTSLLSGLLDHMVHLSEEAINMLLVILDVWKDTEMSETSPWFEYFCKVISCSVNYKKRKFLGIFLQGFVRYVNFPSGQEGNRMRGSMRFILTGMNLNGRKTLEAWLNPVLCVEKETKAFKSLPKKGIMKQSEKDPKESPVKFSDKVFICPFTPTPAELDDTPIADFLSPRTSKLTLIKGFHYQADVITGEKEVKKCVEMDSAQFVSINKFLDYFQSYLEDRSVVEILDFAKSKISKTSIDSAIFKKVDYYFALFKAVIILFKKYQEDFDENIESFAKKCLLGVESECRRKYNLYLKTLSLNLE